jgi:hypothetical protein
MGNRTRVQIECPHVIEVKEDILVDLPTTKDKELGSDYCHGMVVTAAGSGTTGHDAGPLSRYWSTSHSDQLESILTSKDMTCRG